VYVSVGKEQQNQVKNTYNKTENNYKDKKKKKHNEKSERFFV